MGIGFAEQREINWDKCDDKPVAHEPANINTPVKRAKIGLAWCATRNTDGHDAKTEPKSSVPISSKLVLVPRTGPFHSPPNAIEISKQTHVWLIRSDESRPQQSCEDG
jgi:hypothetical protein